MPVRVKTIKKFTIRHMDVPQYSRSVDAENLEQAMAMFLKSIRYDIFEDSADDAPFVMVETKKNLPVPFNAKRNILQEVFKRKQKQGFQNPMPGCETPICVGNTVGDADVQPLNSDYCG